MGLLRAGIGALSGALAEQWRDYFHAEALEADVLAVKAVKRMNRRFGGSRYVEDNIISNGSIVAVNEGQCMLIVDQGRVVEISAEPGEFVYDTSTEPSIFYGGLNKENIMAALSTVGERFAFGGQAPKDQRVYYINTKEIVGNKYGTPNPVPFRVVDQNIGLDVDIAIRCFGEYSYKIVNPVLFYKNVMGNAEEAYTREQIDAQLKTELLTALQPAFARISQMGIRYSALPGHAGEIAEALNEALSGKWQNLRGISVISFGVSSATASPEDEAMIKELQRNAALRNPNMAAAHLVGAQAQAMHKARPREPMVESPIHWADRAWADAQEPAFQLIWDATTGLEAERRAGNRRSQCAGAVFDGRPAARRPAARRAGAPTGAGRLDMRLRPTQRRQVLRGLRREKARGWLGLRKVWRGQQGEILSGVRRRAARGRAALSLRQMRLAAGGPGPPAEVLPRVRGCIRRWGHAKVTPPTPPSGAAFLLQKSARYSQKKYLLDAFHGGILPSTEKGGMRCACF